MAEPLLDTTDGQRWAAEFMERFRGRIVGDTVDEYLLTCWFANAIETGRSAGYGAALNPSWPDADVQQFDGSDRGTD